MKVKILTIILLITIFSRANCFAMPPYEFIEIYKLYFDEQYEVVKAKMKSFGFELHSEVPPYTYNNISYKGEFIFEKKYTKKVYSQCGKYGPYDVEFILELKFKTVTDKAFSNSRIDYKFKTDDKYIYASDIIINEWLKGIDEKNSFIKFNLDNFETYNRNEIINSTKKNPQYKKHFIIRDTTEVWGKTTEEGILFTSTKPKLEFRLFWDGNQGSAIYTIWGFMINRKALSPIKDINLFLKNQRH